MLWCHPTSQSIELFFTPLCVVFQHHFFFLDSLIYLCHSVFCKVPPLPVLQNLQSFLSIHITSQQRLLGVGRMWCNTKLSVQTVKALFRAEIEEHWAWLVLFCGLSRAIPYLPPDLWIDGRVKVSISPILLKVGVVWHVAMVPCVTVVTVSLCFLATVRVAKRKISNIRKSDVFDIIHSYYSGMSLERKRPGG